MWLFSCFKVSLKAAPVDEVSIVFKKKKKTLTKEKINNVVYFPGA